MPAVVGSDWFDGQEGWALVVGHVAGEVSVSPTRGSFRQAERGDECCVTFLGEDEVVVQCSHWALCRRRGLARNWAALFRYVPFWGCPVHPKPAVECLERTWGP